MKQLWVSVAILAGMILLLAWNASYLNQLLSPLEDTLAQASAAAKAGETQKAAALTQQVRSQWQESTPYLHLVQCHTSIDEVTSLLHESAEYLDGGDVGSYTASNARILGMLEEIRDLERVSCGNLF